MSCASRHSSYSSGWVSFFPYFTTLTISRFYDWIDDFFADFICKSCNTETWSVAAFFICAVLAALVTFSKHPAKVLLSNFLRRSIKLQNRFSPLIPTPRSRITTIYFISITNHRSRYETPHSHDTAILNSKPRELASLNLMSFLQFLHATTVLIALKTE